jgi:L-arabinose isomerase
MLTLAQPKIWFVTGSQNLYGDETLRLVASHSREIVAGLNAVAAVPLEVVCQETAITPEKVREICLEASRDPDCAGLILWMHTFSPAKMWIGGLQALRKPFLHLHTQYNRELPWSTIDMDFMNLNQAAHGDREAGFMHTRLRLNRKVVVGHWSDPGTQAEIGAWMRVVRGWHDWQGARFARIGDNMRYVAVTEGDKVGAEVKFGYMVNGYGVGDVVAFLGRVSDAAIDELCAEYEDLYDVVRPLRMGGERHDSLRDAARQELGLRAFLEEGGFKGFTTTFEDLHGLNQLPGFACQRLMADGYGFGAEGDWKTAALLRAMKVIAAGEPGGTSFMEDYTYDMTPGAEKVLGSHMLEICPSIAAGKAKVEIHPLGIGGKADPVRLVFDAPAGPALNASMVDLGNRFRLLLNEVDAMTPPEPLPKLPVARAVWTCRPNFKDALASWIYAGGAHHTVYTYAVTTQQMEDFAAIAGIETVVIDAGTTLRALKQELFQNDIAYNLGMGAR